MQGNESCCWSRGKPVIALSLKKFLLINFRCLRGCWFRLVEEVFSLAFRALTLGWMQEFDFDMTRPGLDLEGLAKAIDAGGLFVPSDVIPKVFSKVNLRIKMDGELTIGFEGQVVNPSSAGFFMVFESGQDVSLLTIALEVALEEARKEADTIQAEEVPEVVEETASEERGQESADDLESEEEGEERRRSDHTPVWQLIDPTLDVPLRRQVGALAVPDRLRLAKQANRPVRNILIRDVEKRVHVSVLKNPKISDEEIFEYTAIPTLAPNALRWVASQPKYARRPEVRMNLIMNPAMPKDTAVKLMSSLNAGQLMRVMKSPKAREAIQRVARRKLMNMGIL